MQIERPDRKTYIYLKILYNFRYHQRALRLGHSRYCRAMLKKPRGLLWSRQHLQR